jgi:hypothetical protein
VARRTLNSSLNAFVLTLNESKQLASDAFGWALLGPSGKRPMISSQRRDLMTELAFFRSFLAWETFLEESFVLYLIGQKSPRGRGPRRYSFPPNLQVAMEWVVPEGQDYATWTIASRVSERAERFFQGGRPFAPVLRSNQNALDESRILRNAIAHVSANAQAKFENILRNRLGTLPVNVTVGAFLGTTVPGSSPPVSFLEHYLGKIEFAARQIVPT